MKVLALLGSEPLLERRISHRELKVDCDPHLKVTVACRRISHRELKAQRTTLLAVKSIRENLT
jgi:hypothetical protein